MKTKTRGGKKSVIKYLNTRDFIFVNYSASFLFLKSYTFFPP
jgi:hypothetical protein